MAKKKTAQEKDSIEKEIKEALKDRKLIIGSRTVLKGLKRGAIKKAVIASNCPDESKESIGNLAKSGIEIREFGGDSAKLGEICGKPFKTVMIGIKK